MLGPFQSAIEVCQRVTLLSMFVNRLFYIEVSALTLWALNIEEKKASQLTANTVCACRLVGCNNYRHRITCSVSHGLVTLSESLALTMYAGVVSFYLTTYVHHAPLPPFFVLTSSLSHDTSGLAFSSRTIRAGLAPHRGVSRKSV